MSKRTLFLYLIINVIINIFLISKIKIFLYRVILRYKIDYSVKLGLLSILICQKLTIGKNVQIGMLACIYDCLNVNLAEDSKIARTAKIKGLSTFILGKKSSIGVRTTIFTRHSDRKHLKIVGGGRLIIGNNVFITFDHHIDVASSILIKNDVTIGGKGTKIFTHGFDCYGNFSYGNIVIDRKVYIGASAILLPGIKIASEINIGAGAVVPKSLLSKGSYGGNPVRQISHHPKSTNTITRK